MTFPGEPIIDAWIQHPTPAMLADPMFASLLRWMGAEAPPELPEALTIGALEAAGVGRALLTAWWGPQGVLIGNDAVAQMVARHPDRLAGVAAVDPRLPIKAVAELRRCVEELGMVGLRMLPWLWDLPADDRRMYPLYVACVELGVPFCLQIGQTGPLRPSEYGRPIPYLERVALEFPELTIVAGHLGAPWVEEALFLARKFPNIYLDTSAWRPRRFPTAFVEFLRGRGRHKCIFGSNYPMIMPGDCLADLAGLGLDDETRRLFLHDNAARVFGLGR